MRVFIAALLPQKTILLLKRHQESLKPLWRGVKWERPEKFHITLKFLGHVEEKKLDEIAPITQNALEGASPFEMRLKGVGGLPNTKRPRIVCFCLERNSELRGVVDEIESALETQGYPREERPFVPHITAGRVRGRASFEGALPGIEEACFTVAEVAIMKSDTLPTGSVYTPLYTYKID